MQDRDQCGGQRNELGDGVDANDAAFQTSFPYMALPHSGPASTSVGSTTTVKKVNNAGAWPVATGIAGAIALMALLGFALRRGPGSDDKRRMDVAA